MAMRSFAVLARRGTYEYSLCAGGASGPLITAAQRDLPQLDERPYLQLFAAPGKCPPRAGLPALTDLVFEACATQLRRAWRRHDAEQQRLHMLHHFHHSQLSLPFDDIPVRPDPPF